MFMEKKMGRPTDAKKDEILKVRIDDATKHMLEYCAQITELTKSEVVREGIAGMYKNLLAEQENNDNQ